ncbi:uncharacterized protein N7446_008068 [Penicillium canescens]|uniref:BZIP domain-containing protein n=1 Tax=Penicillium canescens TaxID=5083 RepID=A0AAD6IMN2_PENCN|nr:uncharacterized protein N7446_008068 [Penicillium canescens]KAJ6057170.1 hypothetical protein N7460_000444 [Penicillium canescens]KAJ6058485.1 hypothetical protein N7446_008068 [Penicillium canescens]
MKKAFTFLPGHRQDSDSGTEVKFKFPRSTSSTLFRRREQLRKAQRTHRLRKDQYFKNLESEVLRLRANEVNLVIQVQNLRNQVDVLQGIVKKHDQSIISAPFCATEGNRPDPLPSKTPFHVHGNVQDGISSWASKPDMDFERTDAYIDLSSESICAPIKSNNSTDSHGQPAGLTNDPPPDQLFSSPSRTALVQSKDSQLLCANKPFNQKMTDMGMEFILALEHPCLPHLDRHPDKPNGHALLASATFIRSNSHQCAPPSHKPALIFDRLLALSEELVLEDELSPTQAWFHLVQQPWTSRLDLDILRRLSSSLLKLIKCHGFGAVMRRDEFEAILVQASSTIGLGD